MEGQQMKKKIRLITSYGLAFIMVLTLTCQPFALSGEINNNEALTDSVIDMVLTPEEEAEGIKVIDIKNEIGTEEQSDIEICTLEKPKDADEVQIYAKEHVAVGDEVYTIDHASLNSKVADSYLFMINKDCKMQEILYSYFEDKYEYEKKQLSFENNPSYEAYLSIISDRLEEALSDEIIAKTEKEVVNSDEEMFSDNTFIIQAEAIINDKTETNRELKEEISVLKEKEYIELPEFPVIKIRDVAYKDGMYAVDSIEELAKYIEPDDIISLTPNYICEAAYQVDSYGYYSDPKYYEQWNMDFTRQYAIKSKGLSAYNSKVAILDSGIRVSHEDLDSYYFTTSDGYNCVDLNYDLTPKNEHGTNVASVMSASLNSKGIASMAPEAEIVPYIVVGKGGQGTGEQIAMGLAKARATGCNVINMSFVLLENDPNVALQINLCAEEGRIMIASAGNVNTEINYYPAAYGNVVSVSAVNRSGRYMNYTRNSNITVAAPGEYIPCATNTSNTSYSSTLSGSSLAAPQIAALAAIAKDYNNTSVSGFFTLIRNSVIDKGVTGKDKYYGYGVIDVGKFVRQLTGSDYFSFTDLSGWTVTPANWSVRENILRAPANSTTKFLPSTNILRKDFATALGRYHEKTVNIITKTNDSFTDTTNGSYYSKYVNWCNTQGIITGTSSTAFSPNSVLTREQCATMIYRYAVKLYGESAISSSEITTYLNRYTDASSISSWAREGVAWCAKRGVMNGTSSTVFSPKSNLNRASAAQLLYNLRNTMGSFK